MLILIKAERIRIVLEFFFGCAPFFEIHEPIICFISVADRQYHYTLKSQTFQSEEGIHLFVIKPFHWCDTMDVLGGKWKISIISSLGFGKKRYSDIQRDVYSISGKMLSRELKDMELNLLVKRTVLETQPVTVQYELTDYCEMLLPIINKLADWGTEHRKRIIGKY